MILLEEITFASAILVQGTTRILALPSDLAFVNISGSQWRQMEEQYYT
jgi:hypothetical protein